MPTPGFSTRLLSINSYDEAVRELRRIGADPAGVRIMAPKMLHHCVHIGAMQCRQANILKQEMLSLGGDAAVARGAVSCSLEATDVILIGTRSRLEQLCSRLERQPFGLAALAGALKKTLGSPTRPGHFWKTSIRKLPLTRPLVMGILNTTPDSFSDGGKHSGIDKAVERAFEMADEGADIIDIGGESTRPGAPAVSVEDELKRTAPVIERLSGKLPCAISVDTWKSEVALKALEAGAEIVNDISGFTFDSRMAGVTAAGRAGVVLMHTRGRPDTMQRETKYGDLVGEVCDSLSASISRAIDSGVEPECIAVDPGIGFAKDAAGNLEILRRISEFTSLGYPVLAGPSRKSFIGAALGRDVTDRLHGTAVAVALLVSGGASIIRVHDVRAMRDVADMVHAIKTGQLRK